MEKKKVVLVSDAIELLTKSGWSLEDFSKDTYRFKGIDHAVAPIPSFPGNPHLIYLPDILERTIGLEEKLDSLSFELLDGSNIKTMDFESGFEIIIGRGESSDDDVRTLLAILSGLNRIAGGLGFSCRKIKVGARA